MPPTKSAEEVRREFLDFFAERGHHIVPSAPVFPQDDPTLHFTNAGMNQFKDVFLGSGQRDYTRVADTQKCIRVSGKHNDLEEVGVDTYHHTFFEMLGNWSFGDYFKKEAIAWAWELLTEVWKLPKDRLWVTVFGGDEADGLPADGEAERLWIETTDIDASRVLRFGRKDNFWEMGDTGPCGPCTEIHIDRGGPDSDPSVGADPALGVNAGNERFIELWNLVFIQFNRLDDRSLQPLPAQHVDTGMGFERVLAVLQGKLSNYDTDLFAPIFDRIGELTGKVYGSDPQADIAFRVVADHCRALSSAFADGALPSNTGRGYVLRRLLRRAARFGRQNLGMEEPWLFEVLPTVSEVLGGAFPEMRSRLEHMQLLVRSEEESFSKTLDRGLGLFEKLATQIASEGGSTLPGDEAYKLYETFGFPQDLVELMARERGLAVDEAGWDHARDAHAERSRSGGFQQLLSAEQLGGLPSTRSTYHDEGDGGIELEAEVLAFFGGDTEGDLDRLVLDASPFYPEGGGQIGDTGVIETADGRCRLSVEDTRRLGAIVVHLGTLEGAAPAPGTRVTARVSRELRDATRANHTATHLMHKALREVLGDHVSQAGSYVGPDRLRFDLSHPRAVSPEELQRIEDTVNRHIYENRLVETNVEELEAAKERGVVALFGEKYDDRVRVVAVGDWSEELCGGTHVHAAGDIGPFVILSERAIQAGVRRIEAVTRQEALDFLREQRRIVAEASQTLKVQHPDEVPGRIQALQAQVKTMKKASEKSASADVQSTAEATHAALAVSGTVRHGTFDVPGLDAKGLRGLADWLKSHFEHLAIALFGRDGDKVPFLVVIQGDALDRGLSAGDLARQHVTPHLGGGGGGNAQKAQGQGVRAEGVAAALDATAATMRAALD